MPLGNQVLLLFLFAIPVACVSWTLTHEDIFRELHDWLTARSKASRNILARKFFYLFTCEYCFSHYVALVWVANLYMSLFGRLRLAITSERQDIEVVEKMVKKDEADLQR